MLELNGITVKSGRKTWLRDVSLTVLPGKLTGVVGARGSGKTELIRVIMGLIAPDSGTVTLEDRELTHGDRQNFGYLPAERGGYPKMKVIEQIVYLARLHGMTLGAAERNAVTLLARLDLSDRAYAPLNQLSGSEVARVEIASVLAADPDVVILDEPFDGLDRRSEELVFSLLRDHADSGVPVLFTSENWELTQATADQIIVLSHGDVVEQGTLAELRAEHPPLYRATFENAAQAQAAAKTLASESTAKPVAEPAGAAKAVNADSTAPAGSDIELDGTTVVYEAESPAAAGAQLAGLEGLVGFEAALPELQDLFKERV